MAMKFPTVSVPLMRRLVKQWDSRRVNGELPSFVSKRYGREATNEIYNEKVAAHIKKVTKDSGRRLTYARLAKVCKKRASLYS